MEADLENARPERVFITHSGCDREYFQVTPAEEIAGVTSKLRCKLATPEDTKKEAINASFLVARGGLEPSTPRV